MTISIVYEQRNNRFPVATKHLLDSGYLELSNLWYLFGCAQLAVLFGYLK